MRACLLGTGEVVVMTLTVGLTYDLRSDFLAEGCTPEDVAEFDSPGTIDALDHAIASLGYATDRIGRRSSRTFP